MNSVVNKEKSKIFETILTSPGMTEKCKVVLQLSRQNVLLLTRLIEVGLLTKDSPIQDGIILAFPKESTEEIKVIHEEILRKAELTEFYERFRTL